MGNFVYPSSAELQEINQDYIANATLDDPIFEHFPIVSVDENKLKWDQRDNYYGIQSARGLNGDPQIVQRVGMTQYEMSPGYYGEFSEIPESELTERRKLGTFGEPVDISDLVGEAQSLLMTRFVSRVKYNLWQLLQSGILSVFNVNGSLSHRLQFDIQTFTSSVPWGTPATSTPIQDMRAARLKHLGYGISFGADATAYANWPTINKLLNNTNPSDLGGKRIENGSTFNDLRSVNAVLAANDLPQFVPYDDGFHELIGSRGANNYSRYILDNKVVVIGKRKSGETLGEYRMTRNANNPNLAPGAYTLVVDSLDTGKPVPRKLEVHSGHNGGTVMYYPSGVLVMNV